jgi:Tol biopolymer transport system component
MMDDDGSNLGRVTDTTTVAELNPDWGSNDRIVYVRSATNTHGIATIDPDGTGRVQLTTKLDDNPAWAPDAATIAFDRFKRAGPTNPIMLMAADGSGVQQVTGGRRYDAMPAFAPVAGDELVFGRGTAPLGADPVMDLWTVDVDGSNLDRLTETPNRSELFPAWGAV